MIGMFAVVMVASFAVHLVSWILDIDWIDDGDSPWSLKAIAGFTSGFGAGGMVLSSWGWEAFEASVGGVGCGLLYAALTIFLYRQLRKTETDSTPSVADLQGKVGTVTSTIHPFGPGEVNVIHAGRLYTLRAFSARTNATIPVYARVTVVAVLGSDSVYVMEEDKAS